MEPKPLGELFENYRKYTACRFAKNYRQYKAEGIFFQWRTLEISWGFLTTTGKIELGRIPSLTESWLWSAIMKRVRRLVGLLGGREDSWSIYIFLAWQFCFYIFNTFLATMVSSKSLVVCPSVGLSVGQLCEKVTFRVSNGNLNLPKTYLPAYLHLPVWQ